MSNHRQFQAIFERRLAVCALLTLPIFYLSPVCQSWLGYRAIEFPYINWITPIFATTIYIYGGGIFLKACWDDFPEDIRIVTPLSFALIAGYGSSIGVSFGEAGNSFYIELVTLVDVMLLGYWIEISSRSEYISMPEHPTDLVFYRDLVDRFAFWLSLISFCVFLLAMFVWLSLGMENVLFAIDRSVEIFLVSCPPALGLAVPLVILKFNAMSAKHGILIKNQAAFERAHCIKRVVFDRSIFSTEDALGMERSHKVIAQLHEMGIETILITGDPEPVTKILSADLKFDLCYFNVLSENKVDLIRRLQVEKSTAVVIDVPDQLHKSDSGISIGIGKSIASESADLVLVENDLLNVAYALKLATATHAKVVQNLFVAISYNVIIGIPLAADVAYDRGILLTPSISALLMIISTVAISINALLLRRVSV